MATDSPALYKYPNSRIVVFAKEPLAGQVKTRLQDSLGDEGCLALHKTLTSRMLRLAQASKLAPVQLYVSSNPSHEYFLSLCNKKNIFLQKGPNLGAKMAYAARQSLEEQGGESVVIVGTDCPKMGEDYLDSALSALSSGSPVVLGPAEDGGYVLVGLNRPNDAMFNGIEWGGPLVLEQTVAVLETEGITYTLLDTLWDVDIPEDLARMGRECPEILA